MVIKHIFVFSFSFFAFFPLKKAIRPIERLKHPMCFFTPIDKVISSYLILFFSLYDQGAIYKNCALINISKY